MTTSGERPATGEPVRRVEAALGMNLGKNYHVDAPAGFRCRCDGCRVDGVARALEAAARCGGCVGLGVLRLPDGDCPMSRRRGRSTV